MRLGQFIRKQCFVLSILIVSSLSYAEVVEQTVENKQLTKFILDLGPIFADYNKGNDNFISGRANTKPVKKMVSGEELVTEYQVSSKIYLSKENFKRVKDRVTNLTKTNSTTEQIKDLLAKAADNRIESVDLQSKGYFTLKKDYSGEWEQAEAKIKMANDDFLDALNKLQNIITVNYPPGILLELPKELLPPTTKTKAEVKGEIEGMIAYYSTSPLVGYYFFSGVRYLNALKPALFRDPANESKAVKAIKAFKQDIEIDPTAVGHVMLGRAYYSMVGMDKTFIRTHLDMLEKAISEYETSIVLDPNDYAPHYWLAKAYERKGQNDQAIEEYKKAIKIKPDDIDSHFELAGRYYFQKMPAESITEYTKVIELDPNNIKAHLMLGESYYKELNRKDEAIKELKIVTRLNPDNEENRNVHLVLGEIYLDDGQINDAIAEFQGAVEVLNNSEYSNVKSLYYSDYLKLGEAYEAGRLFDKAIETYETALKITKDESDKDEVLSHLVRAHVISNQPERGIKELNKAVREDDRPSAYWKIGRLFEKKGELNKALEFYQRSIESTENLVRKTPESEFKKHKIDKIEIFKNLEEQLQVIKTDGQSPEEKIKKLNEKLNELGQKVQTQTKTELPKELLPH